MTALGISARFKGGLSPRVPKGRLEAYSDGVFAIVVTLLVLELHVPEIRGVLSSTALLDALLREAPYAVSYVLSFLIVTVYWVNHHQLFVAIEKPDRNFLWINSLFLMCLSVIPFPTAVLGRYSTEPVAAVFYGLANLLVAFSFLGLRYYAANVGRLFNANIDRRSQRQAITRGFVSPFLYGTGIALAFVHPYLSWACYLAVPLYFVLPAHFEMRAGEHEIHGANEASTTSVGEKE